MSAIQQALYFGNVALNRERARQVVFYGRVSTQHEAQVDALGNQMRWYDDQLRYHLNWTVVDRYIDEGLTGTSAKKRPSFMKMIDDAKAGKFDLIVTREVCRFARNTVDTLMITRELKNYGVEVYFVSDNIWTMDGDGELRLSIMATMAQEESRKISERVLAGQMVSRQNGVLYGNGNIIGYDLDKANRTYVINEEQANTIRMIFDLYAQGLGEKQIVNELSRLGCKDGHGNVNWSCTKISRILRNATYMGYIGYNKSRVNNYLEKKRIKNLDDDTFVYVKGDFEPIVSEDLWRECEQLRKRKICTLHLPNGETRRKGTGIAKHLWVEKLQCRCGASYRRYKWRVLKNGTPIYGYQCNKRTVNPSRSFVLEHNLQNQDSCDAITIPEWKLDMMAKLIFEQVWGEQKQAVLRACQMVAACHPQSHSNLRSTRNSIAVQVQKLKKRKRSYATMLADGDLERSEYQELYSQAEKEIRQLEQESTSLMPSQPVSSNSINLIALQKTLEEIIDIHSPKLAPELIAQFVESVTPVENYFFRWKLNMRKLRINSERENLCSPTSTLVLRFTIPFETAKQYREANNMPRQFRRCTWNDLLVEVYI